MCGVFAFVATQDRGPCAKRIAELATTTERRGPHAWGLAWIDGTGRLRRYRQTGRITQDLGLLAYLTADARLLIGHCRYATNGDPSANENNHPHPSDGGWIVHNGVIGNHDRLAREFGLTPSSECDSEVLAQLVETLPGTLAERAIDATAMCDGELAMLGLWRSPRPRLVVVRRGKPLTIGTAARGVYLASLSQGQPSSVRHVADDTAIVFERKGDGRVVQTTYDATDVRPPKQLTLPF